MGGSSMSDDGLLRVLLCSTCKVANPGLRLSMLLSYRVGELEFKPVRLCVFSPPRRWLGLGMELPRTDRVKKRPFET